jgi:hypothetical protein
MVGQGNRIASNYADRGFVGRVAVLLVMVLAAVGFATVVSIAFAMMWG